MARFTDALRMNARLRRARARRLTPLLLVPTALLASVSMLHATTPAARHRARPRSDDPMNVLATALAGLRLFADPAAPAKRAADALRRSRPADAALLDRIAAQPTAHWIGGWARDLRREVSGLLDAATAQHAVPVLVAYNIPGRDCGGPSAGGDRDAESYAHWIREFASGLRGRRAVVVLEPDALGHLDCLAPDRQEERVGMLRDAVGVLKAEGAIVYLDAGNARWVRADPMATRLRRAGLDHADGFALNVSNFVPTPESVAYGDRLSALVGDKHYILDTSRNGVGGNGEWCNPRGQALGAFPTTQTGHARVDAFLWIKAPGQSDGECNGGPAAGSFWTDYALELGRNQSLEIAQGR